MKKLRINLDKNQPMLIKRFKAKFFSRPSIEKEAAEAYDIWSSSYDHQPENLMLYLDAQVFSNLLQNIELFDKKIIDFGCGTGRNWPRLIKGNPASLTGLDISKGMLARLKSKFPDAKTTFITDNYLTDFSDSSIDIILSTLTIAHIQNIGELFQSWSRVLKSKGDLILTDFHPTVLEQGGKRDFQAAGERISIKNYVHSLKEIEIIAAENNFTVINIHERIINEAVRHFYEKQNALAVYDKYQGKPILYGIHFKKK